MLFVPESLHACVLRGVVSVICSSHAHQESCTDVQGSPGSPSSRVSKTDAAAERSPPGTAVRPSPLRQAGARRALDVGGDRFAEAEAALRLAPNLIRIFFQSSLMSMIWP